ncbi:MAG: endolytic transglycosylase MltG [Bdellovibrionales bacterium]|nr:endolytic transglycosylase MltG [Bdellovibrionales bacterium]
MFRFFAIVFGGLVALAVAGFALQHYLKTWGVTRTTLSEPIVIEFPRGTSLGMLAEELAQSGLISERRRFELWVRLFSDYSRFQAGRYRFESEVSPLEIAEKLRAGDIYAPVVLEYTIPEGFTLRQIAERLIAKGVGSQEDFEHLFADSGFRASLNIEGPSLEGYTFPATYRFTEMPDPRTALRMAVEEFWKRLPNGYRERAEALGISLDEAVRIASLIELETPFDDEKRLVSEVIWRRLNDKAPLAIDASIIYGIPDYAGDLTSRHLRDRSNLYNSRVHVGLPPTAIGAPGSASLSAALEPAAEGNYFYVLDLETGRHHFSKTFKEHQGKVRELVRGLREQRIKERRAEQAARRAARSER